MSGGSMDYVYSHIQTASEYIGGRHKNNRRRRAFGKLLELCAEAAKACEWVDSGDYGTGDENKPIDKVFAFLKADPKTISKARAYDALIKDLKKITKD